MSQVMQRRVARLERERNAKQAPTQPSQFDLFLVDQFGLPSSRPFEVFLAELGFDEIEELDEAFNESNLRGFDDSSRHQDVVVTDLIADLVLRIRARSQLPAELVPYLRKGAARGTVWSIDSEIDYVRRGLTQDFALSGIAADLGSASFSDLIELTKLRVGHPEAVAIGWTLGEVGRSRADEVCRRVGVDLLALPGIAEELAGTPLTRDQLYENWKQRDSTDVV